MLHLWSTAIADVTFIFNLQKISSIHRENQFRVLLVLTHQKLSRLWNHRLASSGFPAIWSGLHANSYLEPPMRVGALGGNAKKLLSKEYNCSSPKKKRTPLCVREREGGDMFNLGNSTNSLWREHIMMKKNASNLIKVKFYR